MESTSRPPLLSPLSPLLPRLPGDGEYGRLAPTRGEPPLLSSDFAPPPPPIACQPMALEVQQRLAAGQGILVALDGFNKYSQLAWCLEKQERQRQAEMPARAAEPAAPALASAAAVAVPAATSSSSSESEGGVSSGLGRQPSRASAVLQQARAVLPADEGDSEADAAGGNEEEEHRMEDELTAELQRELEAEAVADAAGPAAGPGAGDFAPAAMEPSLRTAALPAHIARSEQPAPAQAQAGAAKPTTAAERKRQQQARRRAAAAGAGAPQALPGPAAAAAAAAAAAREQAEDAMDVDGQEAAAATTADAWDAGMGDGEPDEDEEPPPPPPPLQQLPPEQEQQQAQEKGQKAATGTAVMEAALKKIGESSWEAFCQKLLEQARQREAEAGAAGRGGEGGRGGGRGRGRGRKAGRGGKAKTAAEATVDDVHLSDVVNKNSWCHHPAFAAAYEEARKQLNKQDEKRLKQDALKEHSQLVTRWSDLPAFEHEWYLQHQGKALTGAQEQRMLLMQEKISVEQNQYHQHVQQKAAGGTAASRYRQCTARQAAQIEQDVSLRRQRVQLQLPRCYRLLSALPVAQAPPQPAAGAGLGLQQQEPLPLQHLGELLREGQPAVFAAPAGGTSIPGDRLYLPASVEAPAAGGPASLAAALGGVLRRQRVPPLAADPLLQQAAAQARQQAAPAAGAGAAEGGASKEAVQPVYCLAASAFTAIVRTPMEGRQTAWEIPVTIQPSAGAARGEQQPGEDQQEQGQQQGGMLVCLDKPLQARQLTQRAKQRRLQKYAVLSLGLQQAGQTGQQQEQQQAKQRRSSRGAPAMAAAAAPGMPAATAGLPPRESAYDCWQLAGCRLVLRSHDRLLFQPQQPPVGERLGSEQGGPAGAAEAAAAEGGEQGAQQARHVVLALKTEYLPDPDLETFTMEELSGWWLQLLMRPGLEGVLAAHVHVPQNKLMATDLLTAADLDEQSGSAGKLRHLGAAGLALLQQLLQELGGLPAGQYLLAHAPGDPACCLFKALPADMQETMGELPELPRSASAARPSVVYDLHAAHERSGATDLETSSYLPPRWRPYRPDVPQIPFTFPPRLSLARQGRQGGKKRSRGVLPYAWQELGIHGDFDQVAHLAQISKADYMAGLEDELE